MQAPKLGLPSQLAHGGEPGISPQGGNPRAEISYGLRPSDLSFLPFTYSQSRAKAITSKSMETTGRSSRGGGGNPAPADQPTASSDASWNFQKTTIGCFTQDTFRVPTTQPIPPPEDTFPHINSSLMTLTSLLNSALSSLTLCPSDLLKKVTLKRLV